MNCCVNCFKDTEIVGIIRSLNTKGKCDFCGENDYIFPLDADTTLADMFGELIEIYTVASDLPKTFPKESTDLLKNIFYRKWPIFTAEPDCIYRLLTHICHEKYTDHPELFDYPVGVLESHDKEYMKESSIIRDYQWPDFVNAIKRESRFHTDYINKKVLDLFINCVRKKYKSGEVFYRARICSDEKGTAYPDTEMGAPPAEMATAGRVNPDGISVLYLSNLIETTLHETRAGVYDYVTVGTFRLKKDIEVIDFTRLDKISPFIANNAMGIAYNQHAVNIEHLRLISKEIAKPLRRQDSVLDYLPTQYISDYIKSQNLGGVEYISTMHEGGYNLAVFDESAFECTGTTVHVISSIKYGYSKKK